MKTLNSYFKPQKGASAAKIESPDTSPQKTLKKTENGINDENVELKKAAATERFAYNFPGTEGLDLSWKKALLPEFSKDYFVRVTEFVRKERLTKVIYPSCDNVYAWSRACEADEIKVVILGQDPYHGPNQAHGLCFSVLAGVSVPPSLENIFKELMVDIPEFRHPGHGYLVGWAKQGVLLLNACLTVEGGKANSHQGKGWELLTDAVISWLNSNLQNLVFMLWGAFAQKKGNHVDMTRHLVLKSPHPSPLSAHKGFFGCDHFSKANTYLTQHGKGAIDWGYLPSQ